MSIINSNKIGKYKNAFVLMPALGACVVVANVVLAEPAMALLAIACTEEGLGSSGRIGKRSLLHIS